MGTNFYWKQEEKPPCECCQRPFIQETIHIGKSSLGWCFSLHVTDEIKSLDDWKKVWETKPGFIEDEYGDRISVEEMLDRITNREGKNEFNKPLKDPFNHYFSWDHFHQRNYSQPGPKGLLRHKVNDPPNHCVGHGEGTWDLITGYFS